MTLSQHQHGEGKQLVLIFSPDFSIAPHFKKFQAPRLQSQSPRMFTADESKFPAGEDVCAGAVPAFLNGLKPSTDESNH